MEQMPAGLTPAQRRTWKAIQVRRLNSERKAAEKLRARGWKVEEPK